MGWKLVVSRKLVSFPYCLYFLNWEYYRRLRFHAYQTVVLDKIFDFFQTASLLSISNDRSIKYVPNIPAGIQFSFPVVIARARKRVYSMIIVVTLFFISRKKKCNKKVIWAKWVDSISIFVFSLFLGRSTLGNAIVYCNVPDHVRKSISFAFLVLKFPARLVQAARADEWTYRWCTYGWHTSQPTFRCQCDGKCHHEAGSFM